MNYNDFLKLERVGQRAISAAKTFAVDDDHTMLLRLSYVLAELRHAADWLCDPAAPPADKVMALNRLRDLFTENPK